MFLLYKHLKKQKKQKPASQRCAHQGNTATDPETSPKSSQLVNTERTAGLQNDTRDTPAGQLGIEKHHDQASEKVTEQNRTQASNTPCPTCNEEKHAARRYRWLLIGGLFFPFMVQSLDATIIAGALPFIASDFRKSPLLDELVFSIYSCPRTLGKSIDYSNIWTDELAQINWIVSAFNLTSATFIPSWGQFADIFGRHAALQTALVLMLIGSALCAGAPTTAFPMLLIGRALQGISCAGLQILTKIILADKVSLKENAKNNTIFAIVGGLGYGIGPVIGGYLTEVTWRWCFIINLPIAVLGIVFGFFFLRHELLGPQNIPGVDDASPHGPATFKTRILTIDYGGQILFLFGMGLLVLALTWGGSYYPWSDVNVLAPLVIGFVLFSAFLIWEFLKMPGRKLAIKFPKQMAMIPIKLIWSRNAGLLIYINFITGMGMYSISSFDMCFKLTVSL
jgi:MFS family permease